MSVTQLGYVGIGIGTSDLDRSVTVMTRVLGLQDGGRTADGAALLRMDELHHRIALHPGVPDGLAYAGLQAKDRAAFEALVARLEQAGVTLTRASDDELEHRKVVGMVKFADPSGYPLELFFGPLVPNHLPFVPGRPISGFRTGPLGLGHILCSSPDLDACERFYVGLLGLNVSDYGITGSVFFHCNGRQHSIAFGAGKAPRLTHIMLETLSLDDVGRAIDLCEEAGVPIVTTLGKHNNDQMVSFYLETPSGLKIEYGWGGRVIDENWVAQVHEKGDDWGHKRVRPADREARRLVASDARFPWLVQKDPSGIYH